MTKTASTSLLGGRTWLVGNGLRCLLIDGNHRGIGRGDFPFHQYLAFAFKHQQFGVKQCILEAFFSTNTSRSITVYNTVGILLNMHFCAEMFFAFGDDAIDQISLFDPDFKQKILSLFLFLQVCNLIIS